MATGKGSSDEDQTKRSKDAPESPSGGEGAPEEPREVPPWHKDKNKTGSILHLLSYVRGWIKGLVEKKEPVGKRPGGSDKLWFTLCISVAVLLAGAAGYLFYLGYFSWGYFTALFGVLYIAVYLCLFRNRKRPVAHNHETNVEKLSETYYKMLDEIGKNARCTSRGYAYVMAMYNVAFYLGVGLVIAAAVNALFNENGYLASGVMGTVGMADIIVFLLTKPPEGIQNSRSNLSQLQATIFTWLGHRINSTNYVNSVCKEYEMYQDRWDSRLDNLIRYVQEDIITTTDRLMRLIDEHCEFKNTGFTKRYGKPESSPGS